MSYATLRDKKNELIRKARDGSAFIAPSSADPIAALTTTGGALATLPTGYQDLGWTTTDGSTYARATEISAINSFGSTVPTREDVTSDIITMNVTAQETKLLTLGLYTGVDTTGLQAAAGTGEVRINKPTLPNPRYFRVLGLFVDESSDGEIYLARWMPNARITEYGDQQYSQADEAIVYPMTFTGYEDSTLGYSHAWIFGGPGWLALLADMGITQATS